MSQLRPNAKTLLSICANDANTNLLLSQLHGSKVQQGRLAIIDTMKIRFSCKEKAGERMQIREYNQKRMRSLLIFTLSRICTCRHVGKN